MQNRSYVLDDILDRLLSEPVVKLDGGDRQPIDEQAEVECELRLVFPAAELAGDAENVRRIQRDSLLIVGRGSTVEKFYLDGAVLDSLPNAILPLDERLIRVPRHKYLPSHNRRVPVPKHPTTIAVTSANGVWSSAFSNRKPLDD